MQVSFAVDAAGDLTQRTLLAQPKDDPHKCDDSPQTEKDHDSSAAEQKVEIEKLEYDRDDESDRQRGRYVVETPIGTRAPLCLLQEVNDELSI
jgi:hypothetical protein